MTQIEMERHVEEVEALSEHLRESNEKLSTALAEAERTAMRATRLQEVTAALSQARTEKEVADVLLDRGLGVVEDERSVLACFDGDASALGVADRAFTLLLAQASADALYRARSYDAEQIARREAETRAKARADVLGIVAHDLRNPLNVIGASGALLADVDGLPIAERRKMLDIMRRAVRQMNRLIGDLLDATRLQAGRLTLEVSEVDARDIVRSTEEMFRQDAESRHIALRTVSPENAYKARADEGRLVQALGNLIGNALKFTGPDGSVVLSLSATNSEVVFSVTDTGPGLTPDQQAHLFDAFWQARAGDRRGIGLGLTITKGIIEAHGGRIWVESTPGAGSTFSFALPAWREG